jgi:hypothetical protein
MKLEIESTGKGVMIRLPYGKSSGLLSKEEFERMVVELEALRADVGPEANFAYEYKLKASYSP